LLDFTVGAAQATPAPAAPDPISTTVLSGPLPAVMTWDTDPGDGYNLEIVLDRAADPLALANGVGIRNTRLGRYCDITQSYDVPAHSLSARCTMTNLGRLYRQGLSYVPGDAYDLVLGPGVKDSAGQPFTGAIAHFSVENMRPRAGLPPDGAVTGPALRILIQFSESMDSTTINPDTVRLMRANGDHVLVAIDFTNQLVLEPSQPLEPGTYTLSLAADLNAPMRSIRDLPGNVLDDEGGGDALRSTFIVESAAP
jgi:hypothetical protein